MGFIASILKYSIFAVAVLMAAQFSVGGRSIHEHVGGLMAKTHVMDALHAVSRTFDFKEGRTAHPQASSEDRAKLSGLLKKR